MKTKRRRNVPIGAALLPEERAALEAIAREDQCRLSDAVRELIRAEAERRTRTARDGVQTTQGEPPNRTEYVGLCTFPEEKAALEAIARRDRRRVPQTIRELIRTEAEWRGLWPPQEAKEEE